MTRLTRTKIRQYFGVGVRQLARLTGVSYGIIQRINEKVGQRTVPLTRLNLNDDAELINNI